MLKKTLNLGLAVQARKEKVRTSVNNVPMTVLFTVVVVDFVVIVVFLLLAAFVLTSSWSFRPSTPIFVSCARALGAWARARAVLLARVQVPFVRHS